MSYFKNGFNEYGIECIVCGGWAYKKNWIFADPTSLRGNNFDACGNCIDRQKIKDKDDSNGCFKDKVNM